jgi:hypothetical protein
MPMRTLFLAGFLIVFGGFTVHGQAAVQKPYVVQYVDGSVQVQVKNQAAWKTVKVRNSIPADATLRLAKGAIIELKRDKTVVSLVKEGTYPVSKFAAKTGGSAGSGVLDIVAQKIEALGSSPPAAGSIRAGSTAAGVRGERISIAGLRVGLSGYLVHWGVLGAIKANIDFVEEDQLIISEAIRILLVRSDYPAAIKKLEAGLREIMEPDRGYEMAYLLATAYSKSGSAARAWKAISLIPDTVTPAEWIRPEAYSDSLLRKGQIQVDLAEYSDALVTLKPLLDPLVKDAFGQVACLVAYHAFKGLDRPDDAAAARRNGLGIRFFRTDDKGNQVEVTSETAKILATLP